VKAVKHHQALPYAELPAFVAELRQKEGVSARALEFCILTAARTGEVIGATWPEIDLKAGAWTIPASRMKGGREHRVPLSKRAIAILKALPEEDGNDHVFIGTIARRGLSNMSMLELLRGMREGLTVHGFRSAFKDWASETTKHSNDVVEMALAHTIAGKTEAAYRRGDLYEKRSRLMRDWAAFCERRSARR
jgi:integrase